MDSQCNMFRSGVRCRRLRGHSFSCEFSTGHQGVEIDTRQIHQAPLLARIAELEAERTRPRNESERLLRETRKTLDQYVSDFAELEAERDELKRLLPDHCYRCNKRCLYAGAESETGASRCPVCLLEDAKDEIKKLEQERDELRGSDSDLKVVSNYLIQAREAAGIDPYKAPEQVAGLIQEIREERDELKAKVDRLTRRGFEDLHDENNQLRQEVERLKEELWEEQLGPEEV